MSASSSRKMKKDEQVDKACKPKWLDTFLNKTFFESCTAHPFHKNELNKYCINCNLSACQYCASSSTHRKHKILKIYRHIYKDVVALAAMEKFIDCSKIQPYKSNKRLVISLKPLPHNGPALKKEASCEICSRRLAEPDSYRYCSIACKVKAVLGKPNDSVPPFLSIRSRSRSQEKKEETTQPWKRINKRKRTTPCRAPFY